MCEAINHLVVICLNVQFDVLRYDSVEVTHDAYIHIVNHRRIVQFEDQSPTARFFFTEGEGAMSWHTSHDVSRP